MDRFSPFAPASIRVLVLPVGRLERATFVAFVRRLQEAAATIGLDEITPLLADSAADDTLLAPKGFVKGSLLYNYTASATSEQHQQLVPFELFREPLLVLGVVHKLQGGDDTTRDLASAAEYLRERHPRVVDRQLVILEDGAVSSMQPADSVVFVGNPTQITQASFRAALCKISARFLKELSTYTKAVQASPTVQTPGQTARSLQRNTSQRESERRPESASGRSTPSQSNDTISPVDDSGVRQPPWHRLSPATSFDQIPSAGTSTGGDGRGDSRATSNSRPEPRASSKDRISVQGFGSNASQEKTRQRGKARVGIVTGNLFMLAGQWPDALRILVEHTQKARLFADSIWHGKGLESIAVCLLLHSWAGLEFQIPSICYPVTGGPTAIGQRFSVNLPSDFKTSDAAQQVSVRSLSTSLPELLKQILGLYRTAEGTLELPILAISEATVRFCKLLALLHMSRGRLGPSTLKRLVGRHTSDENTASPQTLIVDTQGPSKQSIADVLAQAQPSNVDIFSEADRVALLAGIAAVYGAIKMDRKKAMMLKEMISTLTSTLAQAHRRAAAAMGVHPSTHEVNRDINSIGSEGIDGLIVELGRVYGFQAETPSHNGPSAAYRSFKGNDTLKLKVMEELIALCDASLDAQGSLRLQSTILRSFGAVGAFGTQERSRNMALSVEEQATVSRSMGRLAGTLADDELPRYWDNFLVRGVELVPPAPHRVVLDRKKLASGRGIVEAGTTPGNPLLYDPNASRPGTAIKPEKAQLVMGEQDEVIISLQNPFDFAVDIQFLSLITEGPKLTLADFEPFTLGPARLQRVKFSIEPEASGECKIIGCRVKIAGCVRQEFSIFELPWSPDASALIKDVSGDGNAASDAVTAGQQAAPVARTVSCVVLEPMPLLFCDYLEPLDSRMMLLDGELVDIHIILKHVGGPPAVILSHQQKPALLAEMPGGRLDAIPDEEIRSGKSVVLRHRKFMCKAGATARQDIFTYGRANDETCKARVATKTIATTVHPCLKVSRFDVLPFFDAERLDDDHRCILSFTIYNAWQETVSFAASVREDGKTDLPKVEDAVEGELRPTAAQHVQLAMRRFSPLSPSIVDQNSVLKRLNQRLSIRWACRDRIGHHQAEILISTTSHAWTLVAPPFRLTPEIIVNGGMTPKLDNEWTVKAGSFVVVRTKVVNCAAPPDAPFFVVVPNNAPGVIVHGQWGHRIQGLELGEEMEVDFSLSFALAGRVEFFVLAGLVGDETGVSERHVRVEVV